MKERARRALWPESVRLRLTAMRLAREADNKLAAVAAAKLMAGEGLYAELYELQARSYR